MRDYFNIIIGFLNENDKIVRIIAGIIVFILFVVLRNLVSRFLLSILSKFAFKDSEEKKESFIKTMLKPLSIFFFIFGLFIALQLNFKSVVVVKVFKITIIILICWAIINYLSANIGSFMKLTENDKTNLTAIRFISNILKIVVVLFGIVMIISELGYNINGLLTGLGVGGLAVSLAAQDAVSNLISGFIIVFEKPFIVGDFVITDSIMGTVTDITMRSTTIKTLENSIVTLPNSSVANSSITNLSRIDHRLMEFDIGLLYSTPNELLEKCINDIKEYLKNDEEVLNEPIRVNFTKLDDSSLNISIFCYSVKSDLGEHLEVFNKVNFNVKRIIEENGASFAYPSTSVYIEKK
ncbi:MAG: mechanosensitive ion channel family protein [Eubacterium sp.]|nr:mechanosensitive ion channel family protein [Eubacterium sp.]